MGAGRCVGGDMVTTGVLCGNVARCEVFASATPDAGSIPGQKY